MTLFAATFGCASIAGLDDHTLTGGGGVGGMAGGANGGTGGGGGDGGGGATDDLRCPVATVVEEISNDANPRALALTLDHVFYQEQDDIVRHARDGSDTVPWLLGQNGLTHLVSVASDLFLAVSVQNMICMTNDSIVRTATAVGSVPPGAAAPWWDNCDATISDMFGDQDAVYWSVRHSGTPTRGLWRDTERFSNVSTAGLIARGGSNVYFQDDDAVARQGLSESQPTIYFDAFPDALVADDEHLYWSEPGEGIKRRALPDGGPDDFAAEGARRMVLNEDCVFWASGDEIFVRAKDDGETRSIASGQSAVEVIRADARGVYWTSGSAVRALNVLLSN